METKSNNILVGAFVLVTVGLCVLLAIWIARLGEGGTKRQFYVVFQGSVQGLNPGAAVLYNGLRVGEVNEVRINPGNRTEIRARISIDELTPVRRDTRVRLTSSGLTGVASIELFGGTQAAGDLTAGADGVPPALFAEASIGGVQGLVQGGGDAVQRFNAIMERVESVIRTNEAAIGQTVENVRSFSEALSRNNEGVATLVANASIAAQRIADASARFEEIVRAVDPQRLAQTIDGVNQVVTAIAGQREEIARAIADASRAARSVAEAADQLQPTMRRAAEIAAAIDPQAIGRTVGNIERAADGVARVAGAVDPERVRRAVEGIEQVATTLGGERERIQAFIADAGRATRSIADAADRAMPAIRRLDEILAGVDGASVGRTLASVEASARNFERFSGVLGNESARVTRLFSEAEELVAQLRRAAGSVETFAGQIGGQGPGGAGGIMTRVQDAAQAIQRTAENLDRRITQLSGGLQRFTDTGLRDLQVLIQEGRRTASNVDRFLRDVERNPQQFIFGRSGVPEYQGRR